MPSLGYEPDGLGRSTDWIRRYFQGNPSAEMCICFGQLQMQTEHPGTDIQETSVQALRDQPESCALIAGGVVSSREFFSQPAVDWSQ